LSALQMSWMSTACLGNKVSYDSRNWKVRSLGVMALDRQLAKRQPLPMCKE
jgi:hypothetical protein